MALWTLVFREWDSITSPDLQREFHIDTESSEFLARPWWWAYSRILALLDYDTRLARAARNLVG